MQKNNFVGRLCGTAPIRRLAVRQSALAVFLRHAWVFGIVFLCAGPAEARKDVTGIRQAAVLNQEAENADTFSIADFIDYLRLLGFQENANGGLIRPAIHAETGGVKRADFRYEISADTRGRIEDMAVEIYEYPSASASRSFDALQTAFYRNEPDFKSEEIKRAYIRNNAAVRRNRNLVMFAIDYLPYHETSIPPANLAAAKAAKGRLLRTFSEFEPGQYNQMISDANQRKQLVGLLENISGGDFRMLNAVADSISRIASAPDADLFDAIQGAIRRIHEFAGDLTARYRENLPLVAGRRDIAKLLEWKSYNRIVEVGDLETFRELVDLSDTDRSNPDLSDLEKAAIDLMFRLPADDFPPTDEGESAAIQNMLGADAETGTIRQIWNQKYRVSDRFEIQAGRAFGNLGGVIIAFGKKSGLSPSGMDDREGESFFYLKKWAGRWHVVRSGWGSIR